MEHIRYSRDVVHKYSKAIQKILDMAVNYIPEAEKAYREGKRVIWTLGIGESPFVYACGAIPMAVTEIGRLGSPEAITLAEDYFQLPNETCAMVKAVLGEYFLRKDTTVKRLLYSSMLCEPFNEAFELIEPYGYDVHVIDIGFKPKPDEKSRLENLKEYYSDEYRKAAEWISGEPVDEHKLSLELQRYNRIQRKARTIINLRRYHPTYMKSLPTMLFLMGNAHYFGKPEEYEITLDELLEELSALKPEEYNDPSTVRLVWTGARGQEFNIFEAVDDAGGAIVVWNIPNNLEQTFSETKNSFEAFIDFQLGDKFIGTTDDICRNIEKQIKTADAKGILLYTYLGCSFGTIDMELKRAYFKDREVPALALVGSFQIGAPTGQVVTRVKAFVEMLS